MNDQIKEILESEDVDVLMGWFDRLSKHLTLCARTLFPNRQKGYQNTAANLKHYIKHKVTAINLKATGQIQEAEYHEQIYAAILNTLKQTGLIK